jgi:hypothetical protein
MLTDLSAKAVVPMDRTFLGVSVLLRSTLHSYLFWLFSEKSADPT